jgi:protein-L-isoaspartate(D-aspartate) O-methyltransferase
VPKLDLHNRLVDALVSAGTITQASIEAAFRAVPRHLFLPQTPIEDAYQDEVIFTKSRDGVSLSASSAPSIMAKMLELLQVEPGQRILEIGAGTGYNAALLEELAGPTGSVVTIDIDQDIVDVTRANLRTAGRGTRILVECADGGFGWIGRAPFDRVIVTVGAWDIAPAWLDQMAEGGRLVVPLEIRDVHKLVSFERRQDRLFSLAVQDCRFVQMRGMFAGPEQQISLSSEGLYLSTMHNVRPEPFIHALSHLSFEAAVPLALEPEELIGAFRLWLALRDKDFCQVSLEVRRWLRARLGRGIPPHVASPAHPGFSALMASAWWSDVPVTMPRP